MRLPGGLFHNGKRHVDFEFKPMNGFVELALAEANRNHESLPARVTGALSAAMKRIGDIPVTWAAAATLAVGDRQFLMRGLGAIRGLDKMWMTAECMGCGESFDFFIQHSELPVKEAGEGFPFVMVDTSRGRLRFRAPNGFDQEAVLMQDDHDPGDTVSLADQNSGSSKSNGNGPARSLLARCLVFPDEKPDEHGEAPLIVKALSDEDLEKIEQAMAAVFPETTTLIQTRCPECRKVNRVEIDPYFCLNHDTDKIYTEIHILAKAYHWSERDILSLPKERRRKYLSLIDGL